MSQSRPFASGALLVWALASALVVVGLAAPASAADAPALIWTPPHFDLRDLSDVPGEQAMVARFWLPWLGDISFDSQRRLWAVSEAGAGRHRDWPTYYPLVFAFDLAKLKPVDDRRG